VIDSANKTHKSLTAKRKDAIAPFKATKDKASALVGEYLAKKRKLEDQARAILEADAHKRAETMRIEGKHEEAKETETAITVPKIAPDSSGVMVKKTYLAKVTDLTLIPAEYMIVDMKKIEAYGRSTKGKGAIPGVEFSISTKAHIRN
jgi:hypothetical protein